MQRKKIVIAMGTRKEAIRMCPLILALREQPMVKPILCVTGQHFDLLDNVLECFRVTPDYFVLGSELQKNCAGAEGLGDRADARTLYASIYTLLKNERPSLVLVGDDATPAYTVALAAQALNIPVGLVDADLDVQLPKDVDIEKLPAPIGALTTWRFVANNAAVEACLDAGCAPEDVYMTGSTEVDALLHTLGCDEGERAPKWADGGRVILLALRHLSEVRDLQCMLYTLRRTLVEEPDVRVVVLADPAEIQNSGALAWFMRHPRTHAVEMPKISNFHHAIAHAYLVVTNEPAVCQIVPSLDKPVILLQEAARHQKPADNVLVVGKDMERLYRYLRALMTDSLFYARITGLPNPYGDGNASARIARILREQLFGTLPIPSLA